MRSQKDKIENPGLFVFMFLLFLLSVGLITYGIFKNRKLTVETSHKTSSEVGIKSDGSGDSLSKYFEGNHDVTPNSGTDDYYLQTDPFKNTCSTGDGGGKVPYVISGTVCYR